MPNEEMKTEREKVIEAIGRDVFYQGSPSKISRQHAEVLADMIIARERALLEEIGRPLISIIEYWNRDENSSAMSDALYHNIEQAEEALSLIEKRRTI